ncbi:hypothetical protein Tco_1144051, partial [Tanacetum coccineum]
VKEIYTFDDLTTECEDMCSSRKMFWENAYHLVFLVGCFKGKYAWQLAILKGHSQKLENAYSKETTQKDLEDRLPLTMAQEAHLQLLMGSLDSTPIFSSSEINAMNTIRVFSPPVHRMIPSASSPDVHSEGWSEVLDISSFGATDSFDALFCDGVWHLIVIVT